MFESGESSVKFLFADAGHPREDDVTPGHALDDHRAVRILHHGLKNLCPRLLIPCWDI